MICSICKSRYHRASTCPKRQGQRSDRLALMVVVSAGAAAIVAAWHNLNSAAEAVILFSRAGL